MLQFSCNMAFILVRNIQFLKTKPETLGHTQPHYKLLFGSIRARFQNFIQKVRVNV